MSSSTQISTNQSAPSAPTATTTTTASFDTTTKKKLGKNLNKLTAPPVAPVSQGNNKLNSSSKNGFLLLSTKRPSSGNTAGTGSGGILSSKSAQNSAKPIPSLGLHTEFSSSTHDALLGVVVGASRLENHQQPDAWGVAEKQQQEQSQQTQVQQHGDPASAPSGGGENTNLSERPKNIEETSPTKFPVQTRSKQQHQENDAERSNGDGPNGEFRTSNWDEYGGRNIQTNEGKNSNESIRKTEPNDDQVAFMTKLARQRAEKRRDEEESRMMEQKERAAQRLRELEKKMAMKKREELTTKSAKIPKSLDGDNLDLETKTRPRIVLEKLKQKEGGTTSMSTAPARPQRTLYDPNAPSKSYSSLVAGSPMTKQDRNSKNSEPIAKNVTSTAASSKKNGVQPQQGTSAYSADPESFDRQPVIQLASYEDRDRGDRNASAAPRMLFDPKSGSMIEVTSRDEAVTNGRNRKAGKKNKNSRDKHSKKDLATDNCNGDSKGRRKLKGSKESNSTNQRGKGGTGESSQSKKDLTSKPKKLNISDPRKLPRTCGVLYSRDKKGGFVCLDGCEGDLGYGVHSVPGGRVKNAEVYSQYIDSQKQMKQGTMLNYDAMDHDDLILATGFHISEAKEPKHEWIKPNEKIELITGDEDSPTLQATAREWAPSHTAFSLSERGNMALSSTGSLEDEEDDEEDIFVINEDKVAPLGLGFDPALNMDSVMQSPSIDPSDGLSAVDLTTLSLEPALSGAARNSHIFAFESGATWGASNSEGSNDWGVHSGSAYGSGQATKNEGIPASFLSLSTGNTWGGFGTSLNGDNSKASGE
mmetsp:Transcript_31097/g.73298  ORF Transcript_31097/g.73298 Transcript_31097/m.73298 type:complete len:814 (-) Transcript_31097:1078-3519(-)